MENCNNCKYNVDNECYRFPPSPVLVPVHMGHDLSGDKIYQNIPDSIYPPIKNDDISWCGEHKEKV